jgi:hypothetical protein
MRCFASRALVVLCLSAGLARSATAAEAPPDGTYKSASGSTAGTGSCSGNLNAGIMVRSGVATMATSQRGTFESKIAADGSINIIQGRASLSGKFTGDKFEGNYSGGGNCTYNLHFQKVS